MNGSERGVGTVLEGRYRLEARLSHWGAGECWRAADTQRPRAFVTVKVLPAPTARRTERLSALKLLGDRLAKLQHPGILPLVEVNIAGAQPLVVHEVWEGVSVGEWLAATRSSGGTTPLRAVYGIADRFLAAVGAAHRQRAPGSIIHGAIDHEAVRVRVEVGRDPEVRVVDFGLAPEKEASAAAGLVDGAPSEYGAPEHAREPSLRNAATDVFASAVLVLRLLVPDAVRPRGHRSWAHFVAAKESEVHSTVAALRPEVHPTVWEALAQALARRPEARPSDAERLREMLRAAEWGASTTVSLAVEAPLTPVVPMEMPALAPVAMPAPALPVPTPMPMPAPAFVAPPAPTFVAPPAPAVVAPPAPAPPPGPAAGPPPVPKGMQLGVGSVLGAHRPGQEARPRRATAGMDGRNFGGAPAGSSPPRVSIDDAAATRKDVGLFDHEPSTVAAVDPPTSLIALPTGMAPGKVSLADADRTVQSPFDPGEQTRVAPLPPPSASPLVVPAPAPVPTFEAPPRVVPPAHLTAWDTTTNLPPTPLTSQAPPQVYAPPPAYAPAPRPVDPFALVASGGRTEAGAWQPPAGPAPAARRTPWALWIGLALLVAVGAFLVGMFASSSSGPAPAAVPAAR